MAKITRPILIMGAPATGKTLIGKAILHSPMYDMIDFHDEIGTVKELDERSKHYNIVCATNIDMYKIPIDILKRFKIIEIKQFK